MIIDLDKFGYPVKHRRKVPFNPILNVPKEIALWNSEIYRLESELNRYILSAEDYLELISEAFADNIHRSTKLEGNPLPLDEVRRLTRGTFKEGFTEKQYEFPVQEILNHIGAYMIPKLNINWDLEQIQIIHSFLMFGDDGSSPGELREDETSVYSSEGQELFVPCPPSHIEEEMKSLLHWINHTGPALYPVVAGALLFHEFESIHPFKDGNGRCGRTIFHMYIQNHGLENSKLCFIEQEIVSNPESYYDMLAKCDFTGDYTALIKYFTLSVKSSYEKAVNRLKEKDLLSRDIDEISKRILIKAKERRDSFVLNDARSWFNNISDYILRNRLTELVEIGALWSEGATRDKSYIFADPMRKLMDNPSEKQKMLLNALYMK